MSRMQRDGVELDYAVRGPDSAAPLLLIMGLGMQRIAWPDSLLDALIERGFQCITLDNRDVGLSSRYDHVAPPSMARMLAGRLSGRAPQLAYSLADLADDAAALLHHLGHARAHVAGISMGGMIAQHVARRYPARVSSLSLLATTSGRLGLPLPRRKVLRVMSSRPRAAASAEAALDYLVRLFTAIGSPAHLLPQDELQRRCRLALQRASAGEGVVRQLAAIMADGSRVGWLRQLEIPTLILHGSEDPMLPPAHGRDLFRWLPQAELQVIEGWGHDLPDALAATLAERIAHHARRSRS